MFKSKENERKRIYEPACEQHPIRENVRSTSYVQYVSSQLPAKLCSLHWDIFLKCRQRVKGGVLRNVFSISLHAAISTNYDISTDRLQLNSLGVLVITATIIKRFCFFGQNSILHRVTSIFRFQYPSIQQKN